MSGRYYIRLRGRTQGPLTAERIHSLARRGRFGRHFEVSVDGRHWQSAIEFPELFPAGAGGGPGDVVGGFDADGLDAMPLGEADADPAAGQMQGDDAARPPRRKRRRRTGTSPSIPPYVDPFDPGSSESPPVRKRPARPASDTPDDWDAPLSVDVDLTIEGPILADDDAVDTRGAQGGDDRLPAGEAPPAGGASRRSARSRRRRRSADEVDAADAADEESRPAAGQGFFEEAAQQARRRRQEEEDQADDGDLEEEPPRRRGLFGLFGRRAEAAEPLAPHMQKLHDLVSVLPPQKFSLDDLIMVGSGQDELPLREHTGSGDGAEIMGLLTLLGFQSKATDIHFEAAPGGADVRMRIDGSLVQLVHLPQAAMNRAYGVVKVLCEADLGSRRSVQEGSYSVVAPGRRADYRVSFTPSVHGQKLAIRVLDLQNSPQSLRELMAPPRMLKTLRAVMQQNAGMVLMCGPTGSGKTTTLYSLIRSIDVDSRNVMTLEDPVEYQIPGVTQIPVDSEHARGFAEMLPALLRQDPDVLLIGEIRDAESAKISMQAVMTGHLVLSTVHAPDTLATVYRLLDLNADPNMVGSALNLILSQRLVRVLCEDCKVRRKPSAEELARLGQFARDAVYEPGRCQRCLGTGFSGRRAIFELLDVPRQLGDRIFQVRTLAELRQAVDRSSFRTLRQNGNQLVAGGVTSFREIDRVLGVS